MAHPATPVPASTVVLVRRELSGQGFEIFMNRRPEKMDTYAGVYVFPGGRVEKADCAAELRSFTLGLSPAEAQEKLGSELDAELCFGHWVAAARELFEETGVLLCASRHGTPSVNASKMLAERLALKRAALQQGKTNLTRLLAEEGLVCDLARLSYFYHRVTPDHYPVRFDTRFFLAALPTWQNPLHQSEEVDESLWISAAEALDRCQSGKLPMMPPTVAVLRSLASHGSWASLSEIFPLG